MFESSNPLVTSPVPVRDANAPPFCSVRSPAVLAFSIACFRSSAVIVFGSSGFGGFVHHIACYVAAPGAIQVGDPQTAFSRFPGWTWQIVLCGRCRSHLGWIFRCGGEQFHGLLVTEIR